jgi:predicted Fe-Mo cluster-binding NifX family protein
MKYLIASVGSKLDSFVAKRFEHAAWYLIVDDETTVVDATQNILPHDHNTILARAVLEDVETIVAGKFSAGTLKFIRSHDLMTAHVHGVSAAHTMEKIQLGEIRTESEWDFESEKEKLVGMLPRTVVPKIRKPASESAQYSSDSSRGHHHLQQYGGRGH